MGYETKFFVVLHRHSLFKDGYCSVIGMMDLSKTGCGPVANLIAEHRKKQVDLEEKYRYYFYDNFGQEEQKIDKDKYGDNLVLIAIEDFIVALKQHNMLYKKDNTFSGNGYRRFDTAIRFLKTFVYNSGWKGQRKELFVLTYGH